MDRPADSDAAARQRTAALLEDLRAGRVRRVLAARFARLGDVLFTTPALRALAAALPEASIDYLTTRGCRDLISQHPAVSDTLLFERGAHRPGFLARRRELRREIARRRYDLAVVFESNRVNRRKLARLCRAAGVRHLIDRGGVPEPAPGGPRHSCDRHLAMLSPLGIRPDGDPYDLHYSADDARRAEEILGAHGAAPASAGDRPLLVGFQPGFHYAMQAPWLPRTLRHKTYKAWPRERWSDLGQRLCDGLGARVVLTGAGFERGQAARIARRRGGRHQRRRARRADRPARRIRLGGHRLHAHGVCPGRPDPGALRPDGPGAPRSLPSIRVQRGAPQRAALQSLQEAGAQGLPGEPLHD
jgi:ADP-heptose:LPS heptosyltransferase